MISPESLQLGMMLAETGMLEHAVSEVMAKPQLLLMTEANPSAKSAVRRHIRKWRHSVKRRLSNDCITEELKLEITLYQEAVQLTQHEFSQNAKGMIKQLEGKSEFYLSARRMLEKNTSQETPMFQSYFCNKWYEHLASSIKNAQQKELEAHIDKLLNELYQRIETYKTLENVEERGTLEKVGRLWDLASSKMTQSDVELLKHFVAFLKDNKDLQEIAQKLGRMANDVDDPSLHRSPAEELKMVEEPADNVADDIVGIHQSDNLEKMIPNEMIYLAEPALEVLFYKHFADKRLLTYRMQGMQRSLRKIKAFKPESKQIEVEKGPFLICVDASGSMSGFPEQCAKAMAYSLMQIAVKEDRDCTVMIFSTDHICYELTGEGGLKEALNFLSYRFHGGTDLAPVLTHSIDLMGTDKYRNADLVVISDFIAPEQPREVQEQVSALKLKHNRFHAVNLSKYGNPKLMSMFDHVWDYHPSLMGRLLKRF
ncbi:protein viaA [Enterovibrio norvegicus FF-33]|uniref:ATPase RavA stimulator ViaA n=1 Tax=Enterovibrio TaxID=188143 RepID=UPI00031E4A62|nr:ATPase RavA stimulator ViaA [Enterovibrio norvegicus]OEE66893.1 protein viaA [Enterovibrio norvegicus FF-33]OEE77307.1 protein viaA [Enterovibrio norvegicus FF-162]